MSSPGTLPGPSAPSGAAAVPVQVAVASAHTAGWPERHAAGLVPDRFPYGLDRLAAHGFAPELLGVGAATPLERVSGGLLDGLRFGGRSWRGRGPLLTWEERIGVPALASAGRRRPVVSGVVWCTDPGPRAARSLARRYLPRAAGLFVLSRAQLPVLASWGLGGPHVRYVPQGVDTGFWAARTAEPVPGAVVSVGNDRHRDYATLAAAWRSVRAAHPGATLTLATRRPVEAGEGSRTVQLDHVALREQLYGTAAVAVVPLVPNVHCSGLTATLEAMAVGLPVVTTRTAGMDDYVAHGRTGLLVPPGDPAALAAAVRELLADPQRAAEMGRRGAALVRERFSTARMAADLAQLLREVA
ncbi:glycosyltransferase family 4 protein [Kineococcus indalonis]|uniref:glycosyltransferase family 4 protein n=1 Tax=Kineococcus indalonis TaxID=2696566 RepID=UPI00141279E1|nr:glycosyltransferase family 4 protein [Kineococcus indalonis]NAZ86669.1 glycosyltransferase [Kineococcus indalonis]